MHMHIYIYIYIYKGLIGIYIYIYIYEDLIKIYIHEDWKYERCVYITLGPQVPFPPKVLFTAV